jgi:hypothetical protein
VESCIDEPISSSQTSEKAITQSPAAVHEFVLDSHCQMPKLLEDQGTQPAPRMGVADSQLATYHDLVWIDETQTIAKT